MTLIAYQDPEQPSYHGKKAVTCYGCGCKCAKSAWGNWCHPCNVKRIDRISANMDAFWRRAKFDDAVRAAVALHSRAYERLLNERNAILRAAGGKVTATKEQHR